MKENIGCVVIIFVTKYLKDFMIFSHFMKIADKGYQHKRPKNTLGFVGLTQQKQKQLLPVVPIIETNT